MILPDISSSKTLYKIKTLLEERYKDEKYTSLKDLPQPNTFKDIDKATLRILNAIESIESIYIVGDYDADGIISTCIMIEFFQKALGITIDYIIPNRFIHGYGLSVKLLENINNGLIITVDNGINAIEAANLCKVKGIDLIITDHHTVGEIVPDAYAIINPKQNDCSFPFKDICGANVAWYLCAAIKKALKLEFNLTSLLDLLTIAIIADIMPMKSINKVIVKRGLEVLTNTRRISLVVLKERLGLINVVENDVGFKIAPLINCAGRIDDGKKALEFLLCEDYMKANKKLEYLLNLNEKRKAEQLSIFEDAKLKVKDDDNIIVVFSKYWNEGIIGIVAAKLCEKYKKPSFVFCDKGEYYKGSARSLGDIHLYDLIEQVSEYTINFGGHKGAAGLSVNRHHMEFFIRDINLKAKGIKKHPYSSNQTLCKLPLSLVGKELYSLIYSFRPFGLENTTPLFLFEEIFIEDIIFIGRNKEYLKIVLNNGLENIYLLVFSDEKSFKKGEVITFSAMIEENIFNGKTTYHLLFKELL